MKKLWAYLVLIRLHNCFLAAASVAVGGYLTPGRSDYINHVAVMAAAFFVTGFGNIVNDILDVDSDRINHPGRPLPSGKLDLPEARLLGGIFVLISLICCFWINIFGTVLVIAAIILLVIYNISLKKTVFWGNAIIGILAAMAFLLGGAYRGTAVLVELPGPLVPALFALLMHFGREILKDVADLSGDSDAGRKTAPAKIGVSAAVSVSHVSLMVFILLAVGVYLLNWFNIYYLILTIVGVIAPLIFQIIRVWHDPDAGACALSAKFIKVQMALGILALIIGKNF